jgi:cytochrome c-type biogenesis protein CcmE
VEALTERRRARDAEDDDDEASRKRLRLLVPLVIAAAGIVATVFVFVQGEGTYSRTVDQLVSHQASFMGKPVRVSGKLVHGSLGIGENGCDHRFRISGESTELPVRFAECVVPDNLRDVPGIDVEVTVEGRPDSDGSLNATRVLTKCPSRYDKERLAAQGVKAPHR